MEEGGGECGRMRGNREFLRKRRMFDHPKIESEYQRWMKKVGASNGGDRNALSVGEVLRAHFLIAEFFADEKKGLGGVGPRDKEGHLLHSALSRQFTEFGGVRKWDDEFHIAATALFGLLKNHPFHDGNKRTALLSVLHLLEKQGRRTEEKKIKWENLVVAVADNRHRSNDLYRHIRSNAADAPDADVAYIASRLRMMTRRRERTDHSLTYRQMNRLLRSHQFVMRTPRNNQIGIFRIGERQALGHVGFPGMSREVARGDLKKIRGICGLSENDGWDSKAFFNGAEGMDFLLSEYAEPLRRLAVR